MFACTGSALPESMETPARAAAAAASTADFTVDNVEKVRIQEADKTSCTIHTLYSFISISAHIMIQEKPGLQLRTPQSYPQGIARDHF